MTELSFIEIVVFIFTLAFAIYLAKDYHTKRRQRNTKRFNALDQREARSLKLKKDKKFKFTCLVDGVKKVFIIKAGTIFLRHEGYCFMKFNKNEEIPGRIDILYGVEGKNVLVFKISRKLLKKTFYNWIEAKIEVRELPEVKERIAFFYKK